VNLVRITTTRSFSVFQTVRVAVEQVNLYSRQEALAAISCSYLPGVARGYDVSLAFADLGGREAFDEWVSSTLSFSIPCDASRQTSNAIRALSKDGPEHQVLPMQHLPG